jgi:methionyl-tRNA formyltransferase
MEGKRIVFMGTPEFAVPCLQTLLDRRENLVAVVTQPDKPMGRGQLLRPSPTKKLALQHGLAVLQPPTVRNPDFIESFRTLAPELAVVVAYGKILPQPLLDIPSCGFINVHSSLLPAYRGAAPINWALINGEAQTGVTIMRLDEGMDTGDIIMQEALAIAPEDNAATLHDRLAGLGALLLARALDELQAGAWRPAPQQHELATYAPLLKKEDGLVNWQRDARSIANQVRGLTPWPGCFTYLNGKRLIIHHAVSQPGDTGLPPGHVVAATGQGLGVATGSGILMLKEVQLEGRKKMAADDFLKGCPIVPGIRLTDDGR